MQLGEQDRRVLFGTHQSSQQLQKYLMKRPNYTASISDVRDVFSDLSKGAFNSLLISARTRGQIEIKGDSIRLDISAADIRDSYMDIIWKDIRMLKSFTIKQVCEDTGLSERKVQNVLYTFHQQGLVSRSRKVVGKPTVYTLLSDEILRPLAGNKRKFTADVIFEMTTKFSSPFCRADIQKKLKEEGISVSDNYVRDLLVQWHQAGLLTVYGPDRQGVTKRYVNISDKERPSSLHSSVRNSHGRLSDG